MVDNIEISSDFDLSNIVIWDSWCDKCDFCKICGKGPFSPSFEFSYFNNNKKTYISEGCLTCTKKLMAKDSVYSSVEKWKESIDQGKNTYYKYCEVGLIDQSIIDKINK